MMSIFAFIALISLSILSLISSVLLPVASILCVESGSPKSLECFEHQHGREDLRVFGYSHDIAFVIG
jgi:hypothetical protein